MTEILTCHISGSSSAYNIEIYPNLINDPSLLAARLGNSEKRFAIITHTSIASLYASPIQLALSKIGLENHLFTFPSGEAHKTRETKESLENQLLEKGFGKETCVIAIGGGVVTDIAGYLAATYCRGVPFITIPTSLLGMVDASIGGKTGVNVPQGKNLIGCVYQPQKVLIDLSLLQTLPEKEFKNGVVEMIKHGLIIDPSYFNYLETHVEQLLQQDSECLKKAISASCRIKKDVVEQDERDKGIRHLLNFGHTIGHALEKLTNYSIPHGEAVSIGILVESHIAVQLGFLDQKDFDRIYEVLKAYSLPLSLPAPLEEEAVMEAMKADKKSQQSKPRFVILEAIGKAHTCNMNYCMSVDTSLIRNALHWMNDLCCC